MRKLQERVRHCIPAKPGKKAHFTGRIALSLALCALMHGAVGAEENSFLPEFSLSILNQAGYISLRPDIPDGETRDWYALSSANASIAQTSGNGGFSAEVWTQYDAASDTWELSLDEAWGEWKPVNGLALRLGRSRIAYGTCVAFNPANSLALKDSFDSRAARVGFDGLSIELSPTIHPGNTHVPVAMSIVTALILPSETWSSITGDDASGANGKFEDIGKSGAHGRLSVFAPGTGFFGPIEIGASCDIRRLDGTTTPSGNERSAGLWLSMDLGGFVLGAEGALRTDEGGCAFSLNRRSGKWLAILEGAWGSANGSWQTFARVSHGGDDSSAAFSALFDFETQAARASIEASRNVNDNLVARVEAAWNHLPDRWTPELPAVFTAGMALEYFF